MTCTATMVRAGRFVGPVGDDLVDVHVGLGAVPGNKNPQGKIVVKPSFQDFLGGLNNQGAIAFGKLSQFLVGHGRGLLDQGQGPDHLEGHQVVADAKVTQRPLGARPPIAVRRDVDFPQASLSFLVPSCLGPMPLSPSKA